MTVPLSARLDEQALREAMSAESRRHFGTDTAQRVEGELRSVCGCGQSYRHGLNEHRTAALLSGPLAPLLATVRDLSDAIDKSRALADELDSEKDGFGYAVRNGLKPGPGDRLRAVLPADHEQPTDEETDEETDDRG